MQTAVEQNQLDGLLIKIFHFFFFLYWQLYNFSLSFISVKPVVVDAVLCDLCCYLFNTVYDANESNGVKCYVYKKQLICYLSTALFKFLCKTKNTISQRSFYFCRHKVFKIMNFVWQNFYTKKDGLDTGKFHSEITKSVWADLELGALKWKSKWLS